MHIPRTPVAVQDQLAVVAGLQHQLAHSEQALIEARRSSAEVPLPHSTAAMQSVQARFSWHSCTQRAYSRRFQHSARPYGAALQAARKSTAEVQAVRATDEEAQRGLQRCQKAEGRARGREESASAEAQRRKEEAGSLSEDLRSCRGALKAAEQQLADAERSVASKIKVIVLDLSPGSEILLRDYPSPLSRSDYHAPKVSVFQNRFCSLLLIAVHVARPSRPTEQLRG